MKGCGAQPYSSYENFKTKLLEFTSIKAVGTSSSAPGEEITNLGLRARVLSSADNASSDKELKVMTVDGEFFRTLDMKLMAGKNFDSSIASDGPGLHPESELSRHPMKERNKPAKGWSNAVPGRLPDAGFSLSGEGRIILFHKIV